MYKYIVVYGPGKTRCQRFFHYDAYERFLERTPQHVLGEWTLYQINQIETNTSR